MNIQRSGLLALAATLAIGSAAGCKRSDPDAAADTSTADTASTEAAEGADPSTTEADPSQVTDVGPTTATDPLPAPPAPKAEEQGTAPGANFTWVAGYWWWDKAKGAYEWSPGFWQDPQAEATQAPPEPQYEDPGRAPAGENYTYMPGFWRWSGSEYVWYHGYWGPHREGYVWMHPYWEVRGGRWVSSGWGWTRYDAGWHTRYPGWEFHGGVWERPADYRVRVTIAMGHADHYRVAPGAWHGHVYGRADTDIHGRVTGAPPGTHPGGVIHENRAPRPYAPRGGRPGGGAAAHPGGHPGEHQPAPANEHTPAAHPGTEHPGAVRGVEPRPSTPSVKTNPAAAPAAAPAHHPGPAPVNKKPH